MFLDIISKIFIFVAIHAMIIFIIKSHIAVIKTSLKYFDFRFINFQARKLSLIEARDELLFFLKIITYFSKICYNYLMKIEYERNLHSVFLLQYHLILVVKYRKKVITDEICCRLKEIFEYIAKSSNYQLEIIEFNHDIDHLHILFKAKPKSELLKFINAYKSASSRLIKKEFSEIKKYLWKEYFWSGSYFLATTGGVSLDVLKAYVQNQGIEDNRVKKQYNSKHKRLKEQELCK